MAEVDGLNRILPEPGPAERVEQSKRREEGKKETPFPAEVHGRKKRKRKHISVERAQRGVFTRRPPKSASQEEPEEVGGTIDTRA